MQRLKERLDIAFVVTACVVLACVGVLLVVGVYALYGAIFGAMAGGAVGAYRLVLHLFGF